MLRHIMVAGIGAVSFAGQADLRQQAFNLAQALAYFGAVVGGEVVESERQ